MIIGITGGTGSGKTTLLQLIQAYGGLILDCDAIYHQLLQTDKKLLENIEKAFPSTVIDGKLERKKLGAVVFNDEMALRELNHITHAAVKAEVLNLLAAKPKLAAIDAIGLFEGELDMLCDVTVAVIAPVESRVQRIMTRDGIPEAYARNRIAAQHPDDWYRTRCGYILENDGSCQEFQTKCIAFLRKIGII